MTDELRKAERKPPLTTHACVMCAAKWTEWENGTWTLRSENCGPCCDNVPMGEQMARLYGDGEGYHMPDAVEKKRAIEHRKWREMKGYYKGEICGVCDEPFEKHNMDWSCNKLVRPRFKSKEAALSLMQPEIDRRVAEERAKLLERLRGNFDAWEKTVSENWGQGSEAHNVARDAVFIIDMFAKENSHEQG